MLQIDKSNWSDIGEPEHVAVLPLYPEDLVASMKIKFDEFEEEGLGLVQVAFTSIDETLYILIAHPEGPPECHYVAVRIRSTEPDSKTALMKLLDDIEVKRSDLVWEQEYLGPGRWMLNRLDDNGNEVEMFQFLNEISANRVKKVYEDKGHKQAYFVKYHLG